MKVIDSPGRAPAITQRQGRPGNSYYDLHGNVRVAVDREAPAAAQLKEVLKPFEVSECAPDISVTTKPRHPGSLCMAESAYMYGEQAVLFPRRGLQVSVAGDRFEVAGKGELLTAVLPLMDLVAARRETAMVHAATLEYRGMGICLPAWGGAGKTSLSGRLVYALGCGFLGDDWGFISSNGRALGFPKPMFIKPHHRSAYPAAFRGPRRPLAPAALTPLLGRVSTRVHPFITMHPRLAAAARRWSPEYRMIDPQAAFPSARIGGSAPLGLVVFIQRSTEEEVMLRERNVGWMVPRLVGNFLQEMSGDSRCLLAALGTAGLISTEQYYAAKAAALREAMAGLPLFSLSVPGATKADRIAACLAAVMDRCI